MGMNWRQLLLVVLVAAIFGGVSGFVGDQVSVRWFDGGVFQAIIPSPSGSLDNRIKRLEDREKWELQAWRICMRRHVHGLYGIEEGWSELPSRTSSDLLDEKRC